MGIMKRIMAVGEKPRRDKLLERWREITSDWVVASPPPPRRTWTVIESAAASISPKKKRRT